MRNLIIAIDGHSSCGKSTLARNLAGELDLLYIDSGAMYRAITLYLLDNKIELADLEQIEASLKKITIELKPQSNGRIRTYLNGEDVEQRIRTMEVSKQVSPVSAIPEVREFLVKQQRSFGNKHGVVMDGRDIGTVVFPEAPVKIFLTAADETRVQRRFHELKGKGLDIGIEEVRKNLRERDEMDTNRAVSPLRKAEDAIVLDNTDLNETQTLQKALQIVKSAKQA